MEEREIIVLLFGNPKPNRNSHSISDIKNTVSGYGYSCEYFYNSGGDLFMMKLFGKHNATNEEVERMRSLLKRYDVIVGIAKTVVSV